MCFQYFYLINDKIKKGKKCAFVRDATNSNSSDGHATAWKKDKQQKWQKKVEALRFETSTKFSQQEYKMVGLEETTIAIQALTLHFKIDLFRTSTNET